MSYLTCNHIHFIRMRGRNHHIGIISPGACQNVRIASKTYNTLDIQGVRCSTHKIWITIHDCHIIFFTRKVASYLPSNLASATYYYFHGICPLEIRKTNSFFVRQETEGQLLHFSSAQTGHTTATFI